MSKSLMMNAEKCSPPRPCCSDPWTEPNEDTTGPRLHEERRKASLSSLSCAAAPGPARITTMPSEIKQHVDAA
ncbi:hypothetical protein M419DRAFT_122379 [Trichoderma reesei RUT C-30]|uniref:Uncharacterized protein n=1 Tax=Hypocrea jecorina (strain ATCC 56765 / BCRC 32924 / NRRL 11460 / Rut C-30) TaxID=1344414 RepID=A0A024SG78_HYPJR|nr:hypothetical protein M419DRAFT_122379 [Trichoderma reesei RUT C-30]